MSTVLLEVVTPERIVVSLEVNMLIVRGGSGEIGILPRHAPLATTVQPGVMKVRTPEGDDYVAVSDGFLHVVPERITVLVSTAEIGSRVDAERAARARDRAQKRLAERTVEIDTVRAEAALQRSIYRLQAAELSTKAGAVLDRAPAERA